MVGWLRRVNMVVVVLELGERQQVVLVLVLLLLLILLLLDEVMGVVETLVRVCRIGGDGVQHLALYSLARLAAADDRDDEMEPWN